MNAALLDRLGELGAVRATALAASATDSREDPRAPRGRLGFRGGDPPDSRTRLGTADSVTACVPGMTRRGTTETQLHPLRR